MSMNVFLHNIQRTGAEISAHEARARADGHSDITPSNTPLASRGGNMFDERYRLMARSPGMSVHHQHLNLQVMVMQAMVRKISDELETLK